MWYEIAVLTKDETKVKCYVETIVISYSWATRRGWKPLVRWTRHPSYILKLNSKSLADELAFLIQKTSFPENKVVVLTKDYD